MTKPLVSVTQAVVDDLLAHGIDLRPFIEGGAVQLISQEDAEKVEFVLCADPPGTHEDDVLAWCADCGCPVTHRPHAPQAPAKVCARCGATRLQADRRART